MAFFNNAINGRGQLVTPFTSSGTWTKDHRTNFVQVLIWCGGAGGGSGRQGTTAASGGGGGGAPGAFLEFWGSSSQFGATETVTIGTGGGGGTAQGSNNSDGNPGSAGGNSSFGSLRIDNRVNSGTMVGGAGVNGSSVAATGLQKFFMSCGIGVSAVISNSNNGATGQLTAGSAASYINSAPSVTFDTMNFGTGGPGGGGAGADSGTERAGGNGSGIRFVNSTSFAIAVAAGGTESGTIGGAAGTTGSFGTDGIYYGGSGGGGGGGQHTGGSAGTGGKGGAYGGGGGGGCGSLNGTNSGAGGAGGDGAIVVVEYF
jgi:hypothetical protein